MPRSSQGKKNKNPWVEIGKVKSLHIYPLSSGASVKAEKFRISSKGIILDENMWDNMFVVYNLITKCIYDNKIAKLLPITVKYLSDSDEYELSVFNEKVHLDVNEMIELNDKEKCIQLVDGKYIVRKYYYDCGEEAAEWICTYLGDVYARLAYCQLSTTHPRLIEYIQWMYPSAEYHKIQRVNPPVPPSCKIMSQETFDEVAKSMDERIRMIDFSPNIVITTETPFKEDETLFYKIGEVIIRTLRPCLRCKHDKTFHAPINMRLQYLSLSCETYVSGNIKVGDKVYAMDLEKES